ncbi:hypothetical protein H3H37_12345 [Duganella sp. LX20W]|uniref:Uncharacterized protein n=1 Tax=Rugamonas brunnea TaxID=2758569 RepID=A0A7W2IC42_9BURK|nr:hypothetical protein [Rugamonas brunnea]
MVKVENRDRFCAKSTVRRIGVNILPHFIDLAPQIAPFVGRQAPGAAVGVMAILLEQAALLLGAAFKGARIELAGLGLARINLALLHALGAQHLAHRLDGTGLVVAAIVAGTGDGARGTQQAAADG